MAVFKHARQQVSPGEISKIICILKPVIQSGGSRLVLLSLKYQMVAFWSPNKTGLLSTAPHLRKMSPFFHRSSSPLLVLIACRHVVNYVIAWIFCAYTRNFMTFPPICMINRYHFEFLYNHLSKKKNTILFLSIFACASDAYVTELE